MHSSRTAVRQSCRAHNAYNASIALRSAFCTSTGLRQEAAAAARKQQEDEGGSRGSYSSYESLAAHFGGGPPQLREAKTQSSHASKPKHLLARQALIDNAGSSPTGQQETKQQEEATQPGKVSRRPMRRASAPNYRYESPREHQERYRERRRRVEEEHAEIEHALEVDRAVKDPAAWKEDMQWIGQTVNQLTRDKTPLDQIDETTKRRIDYAPQTIRALQPSVEMVTPMPWSAPLQENTDLTSMQRLDAEIHNFAAYMAPTEAERTGRWAVFKELRYLAHKTLRKKDVRVELFGSEKTSLSLATSDLDLRVYEASWAGPGNTEGIDAYRNFGRRMISMKNGMDAGKEWICAVMRNTGFPIISAQHAKSGVDVQVVCSPNTRRQQIWTQRYLEELPHLKTMYTLVRTMLGVRGLVDVFNGGIGSYGLLMMLVASLKRAEHSSQPPQTAAEQLVHFLDFYTTFDTTRYGLSLSDSGARPFLKHDGEATTLKQYIASAFQRGDRVRAGQWAIGQTRALQPYLFCLQDPANPQNDLGRKSNAIKHIMEALAEMRINLKENMLDAEIARRQGKAWEGESLIEPLIGRAHEVYGARRARVEELGKEVAAREEKKRLEKFAME